MDELRERRMDELWRRRYEEWRQRPRVAALLARIDAGEREALGELRDRLRVDIEDLVGAGKRDLAVEVRDWFRARVRDVELDAEYAALDDLDAEAPACWLGLRVRVTHVAGGGLARPVQVVGSLRSVTERGVHVLMDDLEEEPSARTGSIVRRVKAERLICWPAVMSIQPLPLREIGVSIPENVRAHQEEAVVEEQEAGDVPEEV